MTLSCRIGTQHPFTALERLLRTELARSHPRSRVTIADESGNAVLLIAADDAAALRAALNGVTSVLGMYERTNGI